MLGLLAFGSGWDGALAGGLRIPEPGELSPARSDSAKEVRCLRVSVGSGSPHPSWTKVHKVLPCVFPMSRDGERG